MRTVMLIPAALAFAALLLVPGAASAAKRHAVIELGGDGHPVGIAERQFQEAVRIDERTVDPPELNDQHQRRHASREHANDAMQNAPCGLPGFRVGMQESEPAKASLAGSSN